MRECQHARVVRAALICLSCAAITSTVAAADSLKSRHALARPVLPLNDDAWRDGPPGMPPGGRFAVISGDPARPGPFMIRVELPPGYYQRSTDENIVVLAGSLSVGEGATLKRPGCAISTPARSFRYARISPTLRRRRPASCCRSLAPDPSRSNMYRKLCPMGTDEPGDASSSDASAGFTVPTRRRTNTRPCSDR